MAYAYSKLIYSPRLASVSARGQNFCLFMQMIRLASCTIKTDDRLPPKYSN